MKNITLMSRMKLQQIFEDFGYCTRCGKCCKESSPIEFKEQDVENLAIFFDKKPEIIVRRHLKPFPGKRGRAVLKKDRPCKFYKEGVGCKIYEVRPQACEFYPFLIGEWASPQFALPNCPGAAAAYLDFKDYARRVGKLGKMDIKHIGKAGKIIRKEK